MKRHTPQSTSAREKILRLARRQGVLRARDLQTQGYSREILRRLVAEGRLIQRSRGIYLPVDAPLSEQETLAAAAVRVPRGVVCLLSALRFHELTSQNPAEVWIAIDRKAWTPKVDLPLRFVRFSGAALRAGIGEHLIDRVRVRIYSPAKTVADCFKYRRKIGTDVAVEALRACWASRKCSIDDLWRYAKVCRVTNIMRPYLEAIAT
jgi:predicted transcriptional regulator of viral defense system